ncbi:MAG: DNA polymerase LigD [Actinomycetota bacterium]
MKGIIGRPPNESGWSADLSRPGWAAELKWDGIRTQILTDGTTTTTRSSSGRDITDQFPELADFGAHLGTEAVLDGEIVVFDRDRPVFQRVLQRLNVDHPTAELVATNPAMFVCFDLLRLDGNSTVDLPYRSRRQVLDSFLSDGPNWRLSPSVEDGRDQLWALATERQLEGIVLKRSDSPYRPGARSSDWRKIKIQLDQEFVVGGWLAGQGALKHDIGSLVVGVYDGADLVVAGLAGSGLTDDERRRLAAQFTERADPPFVGVPKLDRAPTWVEPTVVVTVGYGNWPDGGMLRHPVYLGTRADTDPRTVVREAISPGRKDDR